MNTKKIAVRNATKGDTANRKKKASRLPNHDEIAAMAYTLWQRRGGSESDNWFEAETTLKQGQL